MHRLAALLLCATAFATWAAPVPVYKADRIQWLGMTGWSRPADPKGATRFERCGDKLTLVIPRDRHHGHDHYLHRTNAPHLLRAVRGDFDMRVRVGGAFLPPYRNARRAAGLLLIGGEHICYLERIARAEGDRPCHQFWVEFLRPGSTGIRTSLPEVSPQEPESYLVMKRRKDEVSFLTSRNGIDWVLLSCEKLRKLPREVMVGVFAAAAENGPFEAVFDKFSLTPQK